MDKQVASTLSDAQQQLNPQPQPSNKFYPTPSGWLIEMAGESCTLPFLDGLNHIHTILDGEENGVWDFVWTAGKRGIHREVWLVGLAGATVSTAAPEPIRAITPGKVRKHIADAEKRAKAAWDSADKPTYNRLMLEVVALRKYVTETSAHAGKSRMFADETSREIDSVRKAIERAISEIRKHSRTIANHFKATIVHAGKGQWFYDGDNEAWDLLGYVLAEPTPEPKELDPDEIRARWMAAPRDPRMAAVRELYRNAKFDSPEFRQKRDSLLGDKPFGITRPAYLSRETFSNEVNREEAQYQDQDDPQAWADENERTCEAPRDQERDQNDKESGDYESER